MARPAGFLVPRRDFASSPEARPFSWTALGVWAGIGIFAWYAWLWVVQGKGVGAALVVGPLLVAASVPIFRRARRESLHFDLAGVLLVGLVARLAYAYYRSTHAVDALPYHFEGIRLADHYRALDFAASTGKAVPGTGGMRAVSGIVHVVVADDYFASFLVMAWLGFVGCWLLYRAFAMSVGDGDRYRYAGLVLLWPSLCFWPSSLGKESWMLFSIGIASYGAARVLARAPGGYTLLGLGVLGAGFVRPHIALLIVVAFAFALVLGRRRPARHVVTPGSIAKLVGVVLVLVVASALVSRTQELLDIEDFSGLSIESASQYVSEQTSLGGSVFKPANPRSPTGFPVALATVFFRPFPTEASGFEQLATSVEGVALILITVASARRLMAIPRRIRAQAYVTYALVVVLLGALAFGVISNFGILSRQRVQILPFYFALLSLAPAVGKARRRDVLRSPATPV